MNLTSQIAKHFHDIHFGGNWTCVNLKESLAGVTWQQATTEVYSLNTIATLVFHINYFVEVALKVMQGGPLEGHDSLSFSHPPITCAADWEKMLGKVWADAEAFSPLVAQLPEHQLLENFGAEKYGNYYRNIAGIIEHSHYHLGQIVVIKKILLQMNDKTNA